MAAAPTGRSHREELVGVIRQVRNRWRMKLVVRGAIVIVTGALAALALASYGLQATKFSPAWVTGLRVAVWTVFAVLVAIWLLRPLRRRVNDQQVALYVEEHEPSLQAAILSAVHVSQLSDAGTGDVPPVIVDRMIEQAVEKARALEGGRAVGRLHLKRYGVGLATIAGAAFLLMLFGPEFLRQGASALLNVRQTAEAASPYAITVRPGDMTIPRGSDQTVTARLAGFRSNDVALMVKPEGAPKFDRVPLVASADPGTFEGMLFDVKKPIEYYVEADGVRSPNYKMKIVELPAVAKLELEYVYPAYTGLPPQKVESGGDVAALRGTEVRVKVTPTMATPAGQLQLDPGAASGLAAQTDGTLTGSFKMDKDGFYHIELDGPHGEKVAASPKYTIDVIEDQPPTVSFEKPKRDTSANPDRRSLRAGARRRRLRREAAGLDLLGERRRREDRDALRQDREADAAGERRPHGLPRRAGREARRLRLLLREGVPTPTPCRDRRAPMSDIYFVKIRPVQPELPPGPVAGRRRRRGRRRAATTRRARSPSRSGRSSRRRSTSSAIAAKMPADKFKENTVFIGLSQAKLREQVEELVDQMQQRLGGDENFQQDRRDAAEGGRRDEDGRGADLKSHKTKEAMAPEQRALKLLQDAEQLYE